MNTDTKENTMTELNLKETEDVCGGGVITGFYNPFTAPGRKPKKGETGNEQNDR